MSDRLVPQLPDAIAAWVVRPRADRLARIDRTIAELGARTAGRSPDALREPPGAGAWSPVEILGHVRDVEEFTLMRFRMMLRMTDPTLPAAGMPADPAAWGLIEDGAWLFDPGHWAADRQYRRDDAVESVAAFGRLRTQTLAFLARLAPDQWGRGSVHPTLGRLTFDHWLAVLAWHDDNHLAQLDRALAGSA